MRRTIPRALAAATACATALAMTTLATPASASHTTDGPARGDAGDPTIVVPINDSEAGGTYFQEFTRVYDGSTPDGTPVYIYVPTGALDGVKGTHSLDPAFDHNPKDAFKPCAENLAEDFALTQAQINYLGDELSNQIVRVDEEHFGDIGLAEEGDPNSDSLVTLVYNVQDTAYYNCGEDSYTAGYFAPDFINSLGMNVIVLDAFDWANRVGEDPSAAPWGDGDPANDRPELYEGVIAHELEHLLMNYSDPGELSWVDEGLADMAAFLNGYDMTGSHLTYHQVFHRETSLTRWAGGLENYGASFSYFLYLWEQAGGNGDGTLVPDLDYDHAGGDRLIELIFKNQADGMEGVRNAINIWNRTNGSAADLRSATELFQDWVVTMYLDDEDSSLWDLENFDLGPASGGWTIDIANDEFWDKRGNYVGAQPEAKWNRLKNRPESRALPFGASYEKFRNPGPKVSLKFKGDKRTRIAPHTGDTHLWGGYESQADNVLGVDTAIDGGETVTFWNWHFIEEGWDYGFVEALVAGKWVTVPVKLAGTNQVVSTDEDPHGNNTEGNGITGTSGGEYFVDDPEYVQYQVTAPAGADDLRFRYSTDAAYLDTGWFIDDVMIDGQAADLDLADWISTTGVQNNNWVVQVISSCDLTPGRRGEIRDDAGNFVYRYTDDEFQTATFNTRCANGRRADFVVAISNMPTGDLVFLDAEYTYRIVKEMGRRGRR